MAEQQNPRAALIERIRMSTHSTITLETRNAKLTFAQDLIRKGFCKGTSARDAYGEPCAVGAPHAESFCTIGAYYRAAVTEEFDFDEEMLTAMRYALMRAERQTPGFTAMPMWNDVAERNVDDVIELFELAKQQPMEGCSDDEIV